MLGDTFLQFFAFKFLSMRCKVHFIRATSVPFQEVGLKTMKICVRDLSGMGTKHDPLSVNYIVTGGEFCTGKLNALMSIIRVCKDGA